MKKKLFIFSFFLFFILKISYSKELSDIKSLLSSEGRILFGSEPNSILVIDYPENIKKIEEYLKMVDVPPPQVLIEARVVEVKLEGEHSLGINWEAFARKGGLEIGQFKVGSAVGESLKQEIPYKPTHWQPITGEEEQPFTITVFDENINIILKMLASTLKTNILSAPRITTVNNREAEIKVVQKLPWAEPEVSMSDEGIAVTWNINFEEVGIILKVTSTITGDGKISLELEPEVSEKVGDYPLKVIYSGYEVPYNVPIIDKRTAHTKVIIGNGQTLIIGGLIKEKNTEGVTKIPLLGDIPGVGWFFKSKKTTKEKTELLIFVSPTIITPQVAKEMEREEKLGIGRWYIKQRRRKIKKLLELEEKLKKKREAKEMLKKDNSNQVRKDKEEKKSQE